MNKKRDWTDYFQKTRNGQVSALVREVLGYATTEGGRALDLGAGALRNSRFLADAGFEVDAVDSSPQITDEALIVDIEAIDPIVSTFDEFSFPNERYDLVIAMSSLPFNPPSSFELVVRNIIASLKPGGLFCGNLSGEEDEWSSNPEMTFVNCAMVDHLFQGMQIIKLEEFKGDTKMALGGSKWSHQYYIIAKKPSTR